MMPSSIARFIDASISWGAPALTAPVNPHRARVSRLLAARERLQRGRFLEPVGRGERAELVVGRVVVAGDHAGHERAATEVDDPVVGPGLRQLAGADRGDPLAVHHDGHPRLGRVLAVDEVGIGEHDAGHGYPPGA